MACCRAPCHRHGRHDHHRRLHLKRRADNQEDGETSDGGSSVASTASKFAKNMSASSVFGNTEGAWGAGTSAALYNNFK